MVVKKDLLNKDWEWQPWHKDAKHNQQSFCHACVANSICFVCALAFGFMGAQDASGVARKAMSQHSLERWAAETLPDSVSMWCGPGMTGHGSHLGWKLLHCSSFTSWLHVLRARACTAWDPLIEEGLGVGWPYVSLQRARWSWHGERTHSGLKHLLQRSVSLAWMPYSRHQQPRQTSFLALAHLCGLDSSCTALSFIQGFQRFYQNQEKLLGSCPGYRWHQARIFLLPSKNYVYQKTEAGQEVSFHHGTIHQANFFKASSRTTFFLLQWLFSKHKSFPLNPRGGRKGKVIKTMAFFLPIAYMTKFFTQGSNHSLCSGDHVTVGSWLWQVWLSWTFPWIACGMFQLLRNADVASLSRAYSSAMWSNEVWGCASLHRN